MAALTDGLGWLGAAALVAAYAMVSFRRLSAESTIYQGLNVFGSFVLAINTVFLGAYSSAAVNIVWIVIALLSRALVNRNTST